MLISGQQYCRRDSPNGYSSDPRCFPQSHAQPISPHRQGQQQQEPETGANNPAIRYLSAEQQ